MKGPTEAFMLASAVTFLIELLRYTGGSFANISGTVLSRIAPVEEC